MTAKTTPNLGFSFRYDLGESGWNTGYDINWRILTVLLAGNVISATTTAEPGAPSNGNLYIVPTSATGTNWTGQDTKLAYYDGSASGGADAWVFTSPLEGMTFRAVDTTTIWEFDGTAWTSIHRVSCESGITASTTQTQGQRPLTNTMNEISVCANVGDVVTAPPLIAGNLLTVINHGANSLQVFPASGNSLGLGTNTAISVSAGYICEIRCFTDGQALNYQAPVVG